MCKIVGYIDNEGAKLWVTFYFFMQKIVGLTRDWLKCTFIQFNYIFVYWQQKITIKCNIAGYIVQLAWLPLYPIFYYKSRRDNTFFPM